MLIEYKIKFEKDGLTITQRLGVGVSAQAKPDAPVAENVLGVSHAQSVADHPGAQAGGGPDDNPSNGTGPGPDATTAPIILIGPIILTCQPPAANGESQE